MIAKRLNPDWYRVRYNLAASHANWSADLEAKDDVAGAIEHRRTANRISRALVTDAIEQTLGRRGETDPALLRLLEGSIVPAALILYGGTWSEQTRRKSSGSFQPTDPERLLESLRDKLLSGSAALEYVEAHLPLTARTNYNLACAYAQGHNTKAAAKHLNEALRRGSPSERDQLRRRAGTDPSLAPLRNSKDWETVERKPASWTFSVPDVTEMQFIGEPERVDEVEEEEPTQKPELSDEGDGEVSPGS